MKIEHMSMSFVLNNLLMTHFTNEIEFLLLNLTSNNENETKKERQR